MINEILNIQNICKSYDDFKIQDVSFKLKKGEIMGLIGKNGAGKTTILKVILGLITLESGKISVIPKEKIGAVIGEHVFYEYLPIIDMAKIISKFYKTWEWQTFYSYLKRFNLNKDKKIENLSRGMKVKFAITCALSHQAEFLILDEPTSGLDPSARRALLEELYNLVKGNQITILFTSHISTDIEEIADRITYIRDGKIIFSTNKNDLLQKYYTIKGNKEDLNALKQKGYIIDIIKQGGKYIGFSRANANIKQNLNMEVQEATLDDIIIHLDRQIV